jgi:ESCRT-I complex subunit VPS37
MNSDQLKEILHNEDKFDEFIKEMPQIKALYDEKEMLMASNKSLAEYNLSQEPVISEGKQKLVEKYQIAAELAEEVKKIKTELDGQTGKVSPDTMLALLEAANQEAEEESEKLADQFLNDGGDVEEFVEEFREKRKLAHLRRIKIDKMRELIAGGGSRAQSGPARPAPPPPTSEGSPYNMYNQGPNYNQMSSALPYPAQPSYAMPMGPPNYR